MQRYPLLTYNNAAVRRTPQPYAQLGAGGGVAGSRATAWTGIGAGGFPARPPRAILPPLPASSSSLSLNNRVYTLNSTAINSATSIWSTNPPTMPPTGPVYITPTAPANTPIRTPPVATPPMVQVQTCLEYLYPEPPPPQVNSRPYRPHSKALQVATLAIISPV
ncbi:hypothetical protein TWF506_005744 [Arthrobotrys conoides]|uniref:Uncharacterized protein n=1 Tax=Arthrobotrys conoides TaxID=74498 RepID=A0AAN8S0C4_9PEZI